MTPRCLINLWKGADLTCHQGYTNSDKHTQPHQTGGQKNKAKPKQKLLVKMWQGASHAPVSVNWCTHLGKPL